MQQPFGAVAELKQGCLKRFPRMDFCPEYKYKLPKKEDDQNNLLDKSPARERGSMVGTNGWVHRSFIRCPRASDYKN